MEHGLIYRSGRQRIVDVVRAGDPNTVVPACPDWTATDVVRHLTGLAADVLGGNSDGYAGPEWTQLQVSERADDSLDAVLDEWQELLDGIEALLDDPENSGLPDPINTVFGPAPRRGFPAAIITDLTHHEHDLRAAMNAAGARDSEGVIVGLTSQVKGLRLVYMMLGLPTLRIEAHDVDLGWNVGRDEPVATVRGTAFDLFRAMGGRRTAAEIRDLAWERDSTPFIESFVLPYMQAPATSIGE